MTDVISTTTTTTTTTTKAGPRRHTVPACRALELHLPAIAGSMRQVDWTDFADMHKACLNVTGKTFTGRPSTAANMPLSSVFDTWLYTISSNTVSVDRVTVAHLLNELTTLTNHTSKVKAKIATKTQSKLVGNVYGAYVAIATITHLVNHLQSLTFKSGRTKGFMVKCGYDSHKITAIAAYLQPVVVPLRAQLLSTRKALKVTYKALFGKLNAGNKALYSAFVK